MTATIERRLSAVERRMGVETGPLADFSDADLLAAIEWATAALGGTSSDTVAHEDVEEARLKADYEHRDIAHRLKIEPGGRWPYQRARALWHERQYGANGPRSAVTPEELQRKIETALRRMP